jgi:hypothetical protein
VTVKSYLDNAVAYSSRKGLCFNSLLCSWSTTSTISAVESSNSGRPSGLRVRHAKTYIACYQHGLSTPGIDLREHHMMHYAHSAHLIYCSFSPDCVRRVQIMPQLKQLLAVAPRRHDKSCVW